MLKTRNDYDWVTKWRKKIIKFKLPPFNCVSGPNITFNTTSIDPTNVFSEFFTKDLLDDIVYQTNLYAAQKLKPYKALDVTELKCYLGILILNGIHKMPSYRHFWSSDSLLRIDFVANAMSRVRYDWILSNLHLNDNNKALNRDNINIDKLYKVRHFIISLCN